MRKKLKLLLLITLLLTGLAAGCDGEKPEETQPGSPPAAAGQQPASPPGKAAAETMQLTVYYASPDAMHIIPETRVVLRTDHPAQDAVEMLLSEPSTPKLLKVMPEGTKLRSVVIKDHTAYVDFNDRLIKNSRGGSVTEILIVASVVDTLTEFPEVHKVQFLVEGKKVDTLSGHLDVSEPLSRSEGIIKKSL